MPLQIIDEFLNQQIHAQGNSSVVSPARGQHAAAVVQLGLGDSVVVLHLHQTSRVFKLILRSDKMPIRFVSLEVSVFHPDRKKDVLHQLKRSKIDQAGFELDLNGVLTPLVQLNFNVSQSGNLHLSLTADTRSLNELARNIRIKRHISALSLSNPDRRDNRFDSGYIQHGQLFESLAKAPPLPFTLREQLLFPAVSPRKKNVLGDTIESGNTILVPIMNRRSNVEKNLEKWATAGFDEVLLMDWASETPLASLPVVQQFDNVRVIRVDGPKRYIRTWALNLANRCVRHRKVFKCDSDVEVSSNFLASHDLRPGEFIAGDWRHGRDFNERHLHGDVYYHLDDFDRVNGFDERIINYGQEDTNLTDRMLLAGLHKKVLNYDTLRHQEHDNKLRATNQNVIHPQVNTVYYRYRSNYRPIWSRHLESLFTATVESVTAQEVKFRVADDHTEPEDPEALNAAIELVASWYIKANELAKLSWDEKLAQIWKKSVE